ncbi:2-acyl-glycerophospho-ethanolamine acyltransferase [Enhygromyxa salina]|uniref:2-acyl-glycerophospho-ethanolamine acyltransferase n=1 Tax=Enhygromyxa salina TaxID=215803 RepID=A0A2S9YG55_9BACT|nr:lysophospholipid acyltransferase family protein [Enhygromyxa salina]PRQ04087.1 2-acyl-glycerophospho-ethanolamine acyltransferase [Enhygromyxa salina]
MSDAISHKRDDRIRWGVWKVLWTIAAATIAPTIRVNIIRTVKFPRRGPVLLVSNHPCPWDVMMVPWSNNRQTHILGTDQLLRVPYFGWMMPYFSMIPFKKGMKDPGALAEVERRIRRGDPVLVFPEGDRTWTGRTNPVKPGIGRMAKRLGVPVGFVRVTTGHMQWPRWAKYPRSMPINIEYVALVNYPDNVTAEQITADVQRYISVDPYEVEVPPRSFGTRLAHGLPEFMWACPHCFHQDGLALVPEDDDSVHCHACAARWRVDLGCWLRGEGGPAQDMHIDAAYRRITEHFGELPVLDSERYAADGVALEGEAELHRIHPGQVEPEPLGLGHLELLGDRLLFTDHRGHDPLVLPFEPIKAVLMQVGNKLQIRSPDDNFQISPTIHSVNMWKYFLDRHLRAYREAQRSRN